MLVGAGGLVRREVAHHLAGQQPGARRPAGAGRAAGGDDDEVVGLDHVGVQQRGKAERDRGGVAARVGHPAGTGEGDSRARQLGEAVGPGAGVVAGVPPLPGRGILQPEVRAEVDHERVGRQRRDHGGRPAVRQGEEHHLGLGQLRRGQVEQRAVSQRDEVRMDLAQRGARIAARDERAHLERRMAVQQPQQLTAGVATGPHDGRSHAHAPTLLHDDADERVFMSAASQRSSAPWRRAASASAASRTAVDSSAVSVRSWARSRRVNANDFRPAPTWSPE